MIHVRSLNSQGHLPPFRHPDKQVFSQLSACAPLCCRRVCCWCSSSRPSWCWCARPRTCASPAPCAASSSSTAATAGLSEGGAGASALLLGFCPPSWGWAGGKALTSCRHPGKISVFAWCLCWRWFRGDLSVDVLVVHRVWGCEPPQRQHRGVAALALLLGWPGNCSGNQGWSLEKESSQHDFSVVCST